MTPESKIIAVIEIMWSTDCNPSAWKMCAYDNRRQPMLTPYYCSYSLSRDENRIFIYCYERDCGLKFAKEVAAGYLDYRQGKNRLWVGVDLNAL